MSALLPELLDAAITLARELAWSVGCVSLGCQFVAPHLLGSAVLTAFIAGVWGAGCAVRGTFKARQQNAVVPGAAREPRSGSAAVPDADGGVQRK